MRLFSFRPSLRLWAVLIILAQTFAPFISPPAAEARPLLAPAPTVTLSAPSSVTLGSDFSFTVTFDNSSGTGTDVGYGPFIDLIFPVNGADGAAGTDTPDGINFIDATYLSNSLTTIELTFPDDDGAGLGTTGCVDHPYARDTSNLPKQVCGTAGDALVVIQLPFGSFAVDQPPLDVTVQASLSSLADLSTALPIRARGGFQYGADPLDNPCCDLVILLPDNDDSDTWGTAQGDVTYVTPSLVSVAKAYNGPEDETATGPNFPRQYTLTVDIAPDQPIGVLVVSDILPDNMAYLGLISATSTDPSTIIGVLTEPPVGAAAPPGNNELAIQFTGVTASSDPSVSEIEIVFGFFIPQFDALSNYIVGPSNGADTTSQNNVSAGGTWAPLDSRDTPDSFFLAGVGPEHTLADRSVAIQKSIALLIDIGATGFSPGDVVQYTLQFQVSDYLALSDMVVTDFISDGQLYDATFTPTLMLVQHGVTFSGNFSPPNLTVIVPSTGGTTEMRFNVSGQLLPFLGTDNLLGGCVPDVGTGSGDPNCSLFNAGPTYGTITYRAVIQEEFLYNYPSGDPSVDHGDVMDNNVRIDADVLDPTDLDPTGSTDDGDTSGAGLEIVRGGVSKAVYAVNGSPCGSPCVIKPGDNVTFQIQYTLPSSDFEDVHLIDYLPLPIFTIDDADADHSVGPSWTFDTTVDASVPAPGVAKFGPGETLHTNGGGPRTYTPGISTDAADNSITFDIGTYDSADDEFSTVDILFTLTVTDDPFADLLFLTNQVRAEEGSTNSGGQTADNIIQVLITNPVLRLTKGVIYTDHPSPPAAFNPAATGPVAFTAPGSIPRWSGTITSNGLSTLPVDSNLNGTDAGDIVSFAVVIENIGNSASGAFDIRVEDTIPDGFEIPAGGLNLQVHRGDGTALGYTALGPNGSDEDFFTNRDFFGAGTGNGLEISDPGVVGACASYDPTSGANIVIITYDLQISPDIAPLSVQTNTATIVQYASTEGGPNFVDAGDRSYSDDATVTALAPAVDKIITATNQAFTDPGDTQLAGNPPVAIGEMLSYEVTITIPEGESPNVTLVDTLDQGLAFVSLDSISVSDPNGALSTDIGDLNSDGDSDFDDVFSTGAISNVGAGSINQGRQVTFNFGNLTNADTDDATPETVTLSYTVVVINSTNNNRGNNRNNAAGWSWDVDGGRQTITDSAPNARLVEAQPVVTKLATPDTGDAGDLITFNLTVAHDGNTYQTDAFEMVFSDPIPAGMTYVSGSLDCELGTQDPDTCAYNSGTNTIDATWTNFLEAGGSAEFEFQVTLNSGLAPGQVLTNTAEVTWTSLSGDVTTAQSTYNDISTERTGDTSNPGGLANDYVSQGSEDVTVFAPGLGKLILSTNQAFTDPGDTQIGSGPPVAIGEMVQYRLTITIPEALSDPVELIDTLDEGLAFVSCDSVVASAPLSSSAGFDCANAVISAEPSGSSDPEDQARVMTLDFGTLTNSDTNNSSIETVVITYTVVVINGPNTNQGDTLTNNAEWRWSIGSEFISAVDLTVAEAELVMTKVPSPATGDEYDEITYTITLSHGPGSQTDAFQVVLTDDIGASGMIYVDGSLDCTLGAQDPDTCTYDPVTETVTAAWTNPFTAAGGDAIFEFRATIPTGVSPGDVITNTAEATWTSLPGVVVTPQTPNNDLSTERTGDTSNPGGTANDLRTTASGDVTVPLQDLMKSISSTSAVHTSGLDVAIGEIVTYQVTFVVPAGTVMDNTYLTDNMDDGLAFVRCVSIDAPGLTTSIGTFGAACPATPQSPAINPTVTNDGRDVVWSLGDITNSGTSNSTVTLLYEVVVLDSAPNVRGVTLDNLIRLDWDDGTMQTEAPEVVIVEPTLEIVKTASPWVSPPGTPITFTITFDHAAVTDTDAFDLVLTDRIPFGLNYALTSEDCSLGAQDPDVCNFDSTNFILQAEWNSPNDFLTTGGPAQIEFQASLASLPPDTSVRNEVLLLWTSLPGNFSAPQSIYNILSTERRYDPPSPVDVYGAAASAVVRTPSLPDTGFAPGRVTPLPKQPVAFEYRSMGGMWVEIPALGVGRSIVGVSLDESGWNLTWLWDNIGYLAGTAFPGWAGNTALTGHVYLPNGMPGPFAHLDRLQWGDEVWLHANGQVYIYQVRQLLHARPADLSVLRHEDLDWVTLITCEFYDAASDSYLSRLVVRAVLVEVRSE